MTKIKKTLWATLVTLNLMSLMSCKSGYNQVYDTTPDTTTSTGTPPCAATPADNGANDSTKNILKIIATLSCEKTTDKKRILSGQHLGTVNDVLNNNAYSRLIDEPFANNTPAIVSVDYGYDADYSIDDMLAVNNTLKTHWEKNNNGLVAINWTPTNPWATNTFTTAFSDKVNLDLLHTGADADAAVSHWHAQIDKLAEALLQLQNKNITVLLRPLPSMNTDLYWWGTQATTGTNKSEAQFGNLWADTFSRLKDKGLHNILWVFSPMDSTIGNAKKVTWGFKTSYVDIVAGTVRNDGLIINDYTDYTDMNKPLGLSEASPAYASNNGLLNGKFDTLNYKSKLLNNYPFIAYWISWNNETIGNTQNNLSLHANDNATQLLTDSAIITTQKMAASHTLP